MMRKRRDILFLLPSLIGVITLYIIPFFNSLYYAFIKSAFNKEFVGFDNFINLYENDFFKLAIKNTLLFTLISVPAIMLISILISLLITNYARKISFIENSFFLPVVLPSSTFVMIWQAYFSDFNPFGTLLISFLWKYSGLNIMIIVAAILTLPHQLIESSQLDGAGKIKQTRYIILPMIIPSLFFTFVLSFVNSLKIFKESYLLYGAYPNESVYMLQNYLNNHYIKLNYQNISTAAITFFIIIYIIIFIVFRVEKRTSEVIW